MMKTILMRTSLAEEEEKKIASKYFHIIENRMKCPPNEIIIARYSALPYYKELEDDLKYINSTLINSYKQHRYVADIQNWYYHLENITPKTWFRLEDVPIDEQGSFIVKRETNSRKHLWNTHMFAETRKDVMNVACRLMDDSLLSSQKLYVRKYEEMVSFGIGVNGLPITKEFRFFICDKQVVASGFYWSEQEFQFYPKEVPISFINEVIDRVGDSVRFYVVDVGQKINREWMVVELNDGQMSGLSCINPEELYSNLSKVLI